MGTPISLKEYFGGEATGFTPWLQNHPQVIIDITNNSNLELYKREFKVDSYFIDLLFRDKNDIYVIENQYGLSNHEHLGKCIVYSTLVNAKKTIWITEGISDEFHKIFKSLNIDLVICSVHLEKITNDTSIMQIYVYSDSFKQIIYKLNKDKNIVYTRII